MLTSYIEDYMHIVEGTEPPLEYHVFTMLSTLSTFAGRRFWFNLSANIRFYTNLYVVLVGDPGSRKTTAMNIGKGIVRTSDVCPVAASQITKEALAQKMSSTFNGLAKKEPFPGQHIFQYNGQPVEYNQYAIFATELTQFIGVNPLGFLEFLTAVWDEPIIEVETKNKGCDYVVGPYITMIACMTPEIVKGFLKMNVLSSGFARRTCFVFSNSRRSVPLPPDSPTKDEAKARCATFGKKLREKSGEFTWTQDLKDFYCEWYNENDKNKMDHKPALRGWYESKAEMLFKLAMLIALAENGGEELVLQLPHYKLALHYCSMVEKNLDRVFEGSGINPDAAAALQVTRMLEQNNLPMRRKVIEGMFYENATNIKDVLEHLISVERLVQRLIQVGSNHVQVIGSITAMNKPDVEIAQIVGKLV